MGLSRRQFTKEFKLAAVRQLEQGVSIAEAARALEVNPNVPAPVAPGVPPRPWERFSGQWETAVVGGADCGVGAEGRPSGAGDRFLKSVLAAHRRAADAVGTGWKCAVYLADPAYQPRQDVQGHRLGHDLGQVGDGRQESKK